MTQGLGSIHERSDSIDPAAAIHTLYAALLEKGYDPIRQIAHFLLTGDPTYITSHRGARTLASSLERDELIEFLLQFYLQVDEIGGQETNGVS